MFGLKEKLNEKMRAALQMHISQTYPNEKLLEFFFASERPKQWIEFLFLGPIAGAVATRNYYIGLTEKRILLVPLSPWTSNPSGAVSQVLPGRVSSIDMKRDFLTKALTIEYGEDTKRVMTVGRVQFENASNFLDAYSLLPKPSLSTEEVEEARVSEATYKEERKDMIAMAIAVLVILIIVAIILRSL